MFCLRMNICFRFQKNRPPDKCIIEDFFSYFSTKTQAVDTHKNCLNETKNVLKLMGKKIITVLLSKFCLTEAMVVHTLCLM